MAEVKSVVRVFLPTYRRRHLLPRAVECLRKQTLRDWKCELHNDDPADPFPAELIRDLGDDRFSVEHHEKNLGPIQTFNLCYRGCAEPFFALLEDDNCWEPQFLEKMIGALERFPQASLAWCNQGVWDEETDGRVSFTGSYVNSMTEEEMRLVSWGTVKQAMGAIHANGAMVMRSASAPLVTPRIPFAGVEAFRERMFSYPLLYISAPLAQFTQTTKSARGGTDSAWNAFLVALLVTYVENAQLTDKKLRDLWSYYQRQTPSPSVALIVSGMISKACRPLLYLATARDWWNLAKTVVFHPGSVWKALFTRGRYPEWHDQLQRHTSARFQENSRGDRAG